MGTRRQARHTARVILVDDRFRVLLFRGGDPGRPDAGTWWFTPGGEIEQGETATNAARRELAEETGLSLEHLGPVVLERQIEHEFDGVVYDQTEVYFLVRTTAFELDTAGWTAVETATVVQHRWWTHDELRTTGETIFPEGLTTILDTVG
jgi:8-oxo-dGTP pyrophosphatase MutT (NUDIX family)